MDDDQQVYKFSHALYLARQVDREAADMIVEAAKAGLIQLNEATALLIQLSRNLSYVTYIGDGFSKLISV